MWKTKHKLRQWQSSLITAFWPNNPPRLYILQNKTSDFFDRELLIDAEKLMEVLQKMFKDEQLKHKVESENDASLGLDQDNVSCFF